VSAASYEIWAWTLPGRNAVLPYLPVTEGTVGGLVVLTYPNGARYVTTTNLAGRASNPTADQLRATVYVPLQEQLISFQYIRGSQGVIYYNVGAAEAAGVVDSAGIFPVSPNVPFDTNTGGYILTIEDKDFAQEGQVMVPAQLGTLATSGEPEGLTFDEIAKIDPGEDYLDLSGLRNLEGYNPAGTGTHYGEHSGSWSSGDWRPPDGSGFVIDTGGNGGGTLPSPTGNGAPPPTTESGGGGGMVLGLLAAAGVAAMFMLG
jgi:hypothetical protein